MTNRSTTFFPAVAMLVLLLALTLGSSLDVQAQTLSSARVAVDSARFVADPNQLVFGVVAAGATKQLTLTVSNPGNVPLTIASIVTGDLELTVSPTTAIIQPGGSLVFTFTLAPAGPGTKAGSIVFNHNGENDPSNSSVVLFTGSTPREVHTQNIGPNSSTGSVPLGNTEILIQFSNTGSGGTIVVNEISDTPSPGVALDGGQTYTPTGRVWIITVPNPITGASFSLTFPNAGGPNARIAYRPNGSPPGTPWTFITPGNTQIVGSNIVALNLSGFSEWTVLSLGTLAPTLTSVSPTAAVPGKTANVTVKGSNFVPGTTFDFGAGITVNSVVVSNDNQATVNLTVDSSAVPGTRDVKVTNQPPGGGIATLAGAFTVGALAPTLTALSPNSGDRGATVLVTLTGSNFAGGVTTVSATGGITVGAVTVTSPTTLTASLTIPSATPAGLYNVTVSNGDAGTATLTQAFTAKNLAPTVASVSPASEDRGKSITVSVTGTGFETGVTTGVTFGAGITVTSFTVTNATTISAALNISASAAGGVRDVAVTNATPGGGTVTKTAAFTVTIPVSVEGDGSVIPESFVLGDAYPNPFNPSTTIRFGLPERSSVAIRIYDVSGRIVADLVDGEMQAGMFQVSWNAASVSSGTYLVRMSAESTESGKTFSTSKKVALVK